MTKIHSFTLTHTQKSPLKCGHFIQLCFCSCRLWPTQTTSPCLFSIAASFPVSPCFLPLIPVLCLQRLSIILFSKSTVCVILHNGHVKPPPLASKFQCSPSAEDLCFESRGVLRPSEDTSFNFPTTQPANSFFLFIFSHPSWKRGPIIYSFCLLL